MTALLELGASVEWTDADAAAAARAHARPGSGRLAQLVEWLAATQARFPPAVPARARCIVLGAVDDRVAELAVSLGIGLRGVELPADSAAAFAAGAAVADEEAEAGTDLLVVGAPRALDASAASAVAVGTLTGAEPVALLPRGVAATDTAAWIAQAVRLRDARRRVAGLRARPDELLAALESPVFAAAVGLVFRAVARRTPTVLDGTVAVAAALLCSSVQSRAGRWWQVADTSSDAVHARAAAELAHRPLLDMLTDSGDGTAGLLATSLLRAAAMQA